MNESLTPAQLTTLCAVFVGFHLLALPAFFWAMRHRQFQGPEQRVWRLDDTEAFAVPAEHTAANPRRARWMLGIMLTFGILTLSSVVLTLAAALAAPAHPVSGGKCPFGF